MPLVVLFTNHKVYPWLNYLLLSKQLANSFQQDQLVILYRQQVVTALCH